MALQMPAFLREPFAAAMSQSMLLPAFIALFGIGAALFLVGGSATAGDEAGPGVDGPDVPTRRVRVRPSAADGFDSGPDGFRDGFDDDDDYVEYTLAPAPMAPPSRAASRPARRQVPEPRTEPLTFRIEHPRPAPAESWHSSPVESWRSLLEETESMPDEPIGFAHNGFHVDDEQRFRPVDEFSPRGQRRVDYDEPFFDDIETYGGASDHASRARGAARRDELRNGHRRPPPNRHHRSDPDRGYPGS
jgi:hypothetical protein